jgi:hypothetical protein
VRVAGRSGVVFFFPAVIYLLWFAAIFDPVGEVFGLRYFALGGAIACLGLSGAFRGLFLRSSFLRTAMIVCVSFVMPAYGFFVYAVRGGHASELRDTSYAAAGLLLTFSLLYKNEYLCRVGLRAMVISLRALVVVVIVIYVTTISSLDGDWVNFFVEGNVARLGTRDYAGRIFPYLYFLASPMLIYLIAHDLHRLSQRVDLRGTLACVASMFTFALSGTRAHMLIAVAYPVLFYIIGGGRHRITLAAISVFLAVATIKGSSVETLSEFVSRSEQSNATKVGMLTSYADMLDDPLTATFGQGYNAHAWSSSLREIIAVEVGASKTELTYIELVRVYGLVLASLFAVLLAGVLFRLSRVRHRYRWLYPALVIYLINASINPYLFSTNGILPLGLILGIVSLPEHDAPDVEGVGGNQHM